MEKCIDTSRERESEKARVCKIERIRERKREKKGEKERERQREIERKITHQSTEARPLLQAADSAPGQAPSRRMPTAFREQRV